MYPNLEITSWPIGLGTHLVHFIFTYINTIHTILFMVDTPWHLYSTKTQQNNEYEGHIQPSMNDLHRNQSPKHLGNRPSSQFSSKIPSFNEYVVFLVLEEERSNALRSVYGKGNSDLACINDATKEEEALDLPSRYQHLTLTAEWFISRLNKPVQERKASAELWKALDKVSYLLIRDLTRYLIQRSNKSKKPTNMFQALVSLLLYILACMTSNCISQFTSSYIRFEGMGSQETRSTSVTPYSKFTEGCEET